MPLLHRSITEPREPELVSHVLNDLHYRDTLFNIKGMRTKDARVLECVELREFRNQLAGDIDILVIPNGSPEQSTAIQVKRFEARVSLDSEGHDAVTGGTPERFRKLMEKGVKQANLTKSVRFAHTCLWIFVVIDTRAKNNGWYTYDGPDSFLNSQIRQAISPVGLDPAVGLMQFEWVQPMDRPPLELTTQGGHLMKLADSTPRAPDLTDWLRTLPSPVFIPSTL